MSNKSVQGKSSVTFVWTLAGAQVMLEEGKWVKMGVPRATLPMPWWVAFTQVRLPCLLDHVFLVLDI
jgi:hypothetical protein